MTNKGKSRSQAKGKSRYTSGDKSVMGFNVENDGLDHINIYTMGKTELGRVLSHFAHTPFKHPYFGPFYSMEGFWYYASAGFKEENSQMRYLSGSRAKRTGKTLKQVHYDEFMQDIIAANYQKIIQHDRIRELMIESELPFDHYYVYGPNNIHVTPKSADKLIKGFEEIRKALKQGIVPQVWLDAERRYLNPQK